MREVTTGNILEVVQDHERQFEAFRAARMRWWQVITGLVIATFAAACGSCILIIAQHLGWH